MLAREAIRICIGEIGGPPVGDSGQKPGGPVAPGDHRRGEFVFAGTAHNVQHSPTEHRHTLLGDLAWGRDTELDITLSTIPEDLYNVAR